MKSDEAPVTAFRHEDVVVGVRAPDDATAYRVADLMPAYAGPPGGRADECWVVRRVGAAWFVGQDGGPGDTFPSLDRALEAVEFLIAIRLLRGCAALTHLHAAGVVHRDRATLALGEPEAGKSTLALRWSVAGHRVLGDDIVLLDDRARTRPFKRLFSVHRDRLRDAGVTPDRPWNADDAETWFDPARASGWADPAPLGTLAVIRRRRGATFACRDLSAGEALAALTGAVMETGLGVGPSFDRLVAAARSARAVAVEYGDAATAAARLLTL